MVDNKKINTSIRLYPIFYAFSADLIFFVPIDTLFLSIVKGLNAGQISAITMIGLLVCILSKSIITRIINKIGNANSIRIGTFLLLFSSILLMYGKTFITIVLYKIMYELGFMFWNMASVLLRNDLISINRGNEFFTIRNKAKVLYGIMTMLTALVSGYLFNIDKYIPMYISIAICLVIFLLSFKFYEEKFEIKKEDDMHNKNTKITSTIFLVLLSNALFYGIIKMGQNNSKLFMQYDFQKVISLEMVTYYITIIVFISRIVRIIGNVILGKLYLKIKDKMSIVLTVLESMAFLFLVLGHFTPNFTLKVIMMALGFFLILGIRDSFQIYIEDVALKITEKEEQQKIMINIETYRKIVQLILSVAFTLILIKHELVVIEIILLILSVCEIFINKMMYQKLEKRELCKQNN